MSIKVDLKIFLFVLLFCITSQIDMYILLMAFACIHELAHLFTGMLLGFKANEFKITPVGLQVGFKVTYEEYNCKVLKGNSLGIKKLIIALAGPMINYIIVCVLIVLHQVNIINISNVFYQNMVYANLLIGIFNLIPIYPLDGGRVLNELLHIFVGLKHAYKCTHIISKTTIIILTMVSSIAVLYIQNISIIIILGYLWILVLKESKRYHTREQINRVKEKMEEQKNWSKKYDTDVKESESQKQKFIRY